MNSRPLKSPQPYSSCFKLNPWKTSSDPNLFWGKQPIFLFLNQKDKRKLTNHSGTTNHITHNRMSLQNFVFYYVNPNLKNRILNMDILTFLDSIIEINALLIAIKYIFTRIIISKIMAIAQFFDVKMYVHNTGYSHFLQLADLQWLYYWQKNCSLLTFIHPKKLVLS